MKITPAHDHNDFECGQRHKLPFINVFSDSGRINACGGPFADQHRFKKNTQHVTSILPARCENSKCIYALVSSTRTKNTQQQRDEGVQLKAAPSEVEQDIVLTLSDYAVCSLSWEDSRESDTTPGPIIHWAGFKLRV